MTWTRTFHRIWFDEPERPEFLKWRDKLQELHPGWKIRTWDRSDEVRDLIDDQSLRDAWDRYMTSDPFGRIPDIARYLLLWHYGGVYIDTDFEPLRAMDELLEDPRPFAAWENDRTMCTALLASPAKHPAMEVLLSGVTERLKQTEGQTANNAVGPEYATALWRERDDVRRLPPWTFYPVGWWEKPLLGDISYPERTFAVHHWAKGWDPVAPAVIKKKPEMPSLSVLVAFRDVDGSRTPLWDFVQGMFERHLPEAELIVGTDDGIDPFHKTLALNRAAAKATGEVLMVTDSDTWLDADAVRMAATFVNETPTRWSKPWTLKLKLNEEATKHVMALGESWDGKMRDHRPFGRPESQNAFGHAPPLLLHRSAFDTVQGFDERFRGWGQEDVAFSLSLQRFFGPPKKFPVKCIHLWHPRLGISGNDRWEGQPNPLTNRDLVSEYRRAGNANQMRALIERRVSEYRSSDESIRDSANA